MRPIKCRNIHRVSHVQITNTTLADLDIENEDDVITPEKPEIENLLSKFSSDLNQISPPFISTSHKNVEIFIAFCISKLPIRQDINIIGK